MIKLKLIGADALVKIGQLASKARGQLMTDLVQASKRFGFDAVAIAKRNYLSGPRPDAIGVGTGRLRASVASEVKQSGNVITTDIGTNVVYAPIQEFGGTTHPNVTERMRRFAWAMFFKTNDEKYKRMALTKKNQLTIKIPPRPFLKPAVEDAMPSFQDNIARILGKMTFGEGL